VGYDRRSVPCNRTRRCSDRSEVLERQRVLELHLRAGIHGGTAILRPLPRYPCGVAGLQGVRAGAGAGGRTIRARPVDPVLQEPAERDQHKPSADRNEGEHQHDLGNVIEPVE
jgi:hypothetical protein